MAPGSPVSPPICPRGMTSMTGRVFVDTNVLIYALDPDEPKKRTMSADLLRRTIASRTLTLSPQSLNEAYRVLTQRRRLMPVDKARGYIRTLAPWAIAPLDARTTERAFKIEDETRYSWWDSLLLASAVEADCRLFLSEELQDGHEIGAMRIASPFSAGLAKQSAQKRHRH